VFTLEQLLVLLDQLREEAVSSVEHPPEDQRTEFGFGRAAGFLQFGSQLRQRLNEIAEGRDQQD